MGIILFILLRLLFVASIVFIIGYIYGSFSKRRVLTVLSRIGVVIVIVFFIAANMLFFKGGPRQWRHQPHERHCTDSLYR